MVSCGPAPPCWMAFVTSSLRSSASRCLITPGTPTLDDSTERRATPAARLPPGTVNETIFASLIATRPVQSYRYGAPSQPPPGNIPPLRLTPLWRRGGVVTQRPAKPLTPVRFRSAPLERQRHEQDRGAEEGPCDAAEHQRRAPLLAPGHGVRCQAGDQPGYCEGSFNLGEVLE